MDSFPAAGLAGNATDSVRAAVPTPRYLPRGYAPLSGSCPPVAISLAHTAGLLPLAREARHGQRAGFLPSHALGPRGRDAAPAFFGRLPQAECRSVQRVYAVPCVCSLARGLQMQVYHMEVPICSPGGGATTRGPRPHPPPL